MTRIDIKIRDISNGCIVDFNGWFTVRGELYIEGFENAIDKACELLQEEKKEYVSTMEFIKKGMEKDE